MVRKTFHQLLRVGQHLNEPVHSLHIRVEKIIVFCAFPAQLHKARFLQNPDVMGYEGVKAAVAAVNGEDLGGAVTDTGVSVLKKE